MSVPRFSALEVERSLAGVGRLVLSNLAIPIVRGILGQQLRRARSVKSLMWRKWIEMFVLVRPKYVEEEAMSSLVAYVMRFELP